MSADEKTNCTKVPYHTYAAVVFDYTGWLKIKYPTEQYTISPQPVVLF